MWPLMVAALPFMLIALTKVTGVGVRSGSRSRGMRRGSRCRGMRRGSGSRGMRRGSRSWGVRRGSRSWGMRRGSRSWGMRRGSRSRGMRVGVGVGVWGVGVGVGCWCGESRGGRSRKSHRKGDFPDHWHYKRKPQCNKSCCWPGWLLLPTYCFRHHSHRVIRTMTSGTPPNAIAGEVTFAVGIPSDRNTCALRWNRKPQRAQADHEAQKEPPVMEFVVDSCFYSRARARAPRNDAALKSAILPRKVRALLSAKSSIYRPARCFLTTAAQIRFANLKVSGEES